MTAKKFGILTVLIFSCLTVIPIMILLLEASDCDYGQPSVLDKLLRGLE